MKILLVNLPLYGHVIPTIGLVQELIKLGCEVTYMLPHSWEKRIQSSGAKFYGYDDDAKFARQIKNAYKAMNAILDDYDLLLYEAFFFVGKHLSEIRGKPAVRIFTTTAVNKPLMKQFLQKGHMSIFRIKWVARKFTRDVAYGIPLKTDNWLDEVVENPEDVNLIYCLKEFQPYLEEFPEEAFKFLGPSVYDREEEPFFFEKRRPIVYISLGSMLKGSRQFFRTCFDALGQEDVDVIMSSSRSFDKESVPSNFHIYSWVPQVQVLKMTDVFVTHGGMNSVSEALVAGVPMVVIPHGSDQSVNGQCVEKLGVGKVLNMRFISRKNLKNKVLSTLSDDAMKNRMKDVQGMIDRALGNKGGALAIMEYYDEFKKGIRK